ncbi:MAG TPA: tetratricopeptide repeat protein [Steroidobacteraceae bacterium]|nr:tetratricopeptide repeat protein [Steroidobacteraceae bacterium]
MNRLVLSAASLLCASVSFAARTVPDKLLSAEQVLASTEQAATPAAAADHPNDPAKLLADIREFRAGAARLEPAAAATRWFELYDRARTVGVDPDHMSADSVDMETQRPVDTKSVFLALPPPAAWPALRKLATERALRATQDREALGLRFLAEVLAGDSKSAAGTLDGLAGVFKNLGPDERQQADMALAMTRAKLVGTYGSPQEVADAFDAQVRSGGVGYNPYVKVPDLVGLVGEQAATEKLVAALRSPSVLSIESGDATRALARHLALEHIDDMRVPQWQLTDSVDSGPLYEAIEKRFDPANAGATDKNDYAKSVRDYQKVEASVWYFLGSVIGGRQADAERALTTIGGESEIYLPKAAVEALRRSGHDEALFRFLDAQLAHRPQLRAWDVYIQQAAMTGHAADSLARIEEALARKDLTDFLRADLRVRRVTALLGADRIDAAARGFRDLLKAPPVRNEVTLATRYGAALDAAAVGRLVGNDDLASLGLNFAIAVQPLLPDERSGQVSDRQLKLWRELRKSGRTADVQKLAMTALTRKGSRSGFESLVANSSQQEIAALVELASIWSEAGRHEDVTKMLAGSRHWGVGDAGKLLANRDSMNQPFGVVVARTLRARGDNAAALRAALATVSQVPGNDASYEIIVALDPATLATLDRLYKLDEYEERPLIWKASVQLAAGSLAEAEATVRRAIAIDPSDGEQGPGDRMRAYAVLAEILGKKGDTDSAAIYLKAVDAIRRSERTDEFYAANLYQRAFRGYREALEQFSDAYCIQSRLAVQLYRQGNRTEALEHYRRAYELMPDSFGRVESHCFGCESVFQGPDAQSVAETVFQGVISKSPGKAQAYYLLAYLRQQQDRDSESIQPLRQAVSLDPRYLNAWLLLYEAGDHAYIAPPELDIARLKLLELDPMHRHARYTVEKVGDLAALWRGAERAAVAASAARPVTDGVQRLEASAAVAEEARKALPAEMQSQIRMFEAMNARSMDGSTQLAPTTVLGTHQLVRMTEALLGDMDQLRGEY